MLVLWSCDSRFLGYNKGRALPAVDVAQIDTLVSPSDTMVALEQQMPLSRGSSRGPAAYRGFSVC